MYGNALTLSTLLAMSLVSTSHLVLSSAVMASLDSLILLLITVAWFVIASSAESLILSHAHSTALYLQKTVQNLITCTYIS